MISACMQPTFCSSNLCRRSVGRAAIAAFLTVVFVGAASAANRAESGAVLHFGYSTGPTSFDPARSTSGGDRVYLFPVYDRLVRLDNSANPHAMLATEWSFKNSGKAVVLTLRKGIHFEDGTALDANAVKANLDRFRNLPASTQKATLRAISDVKVLDPAHVEIDCSIGCGGLIQTLGDTAGMMVNPSAFANPELGQRPFGAGPYKLVKYESGSRAVYAPFSGYYDPANQTLAGLQISILPNDATRLNALRSGQIDMTFIRPYQVAEAKGSGLNVVGSRSFIWYYLGMNINRSKFSDLRVRKALNYAVDKKGIAESLLKGYCTPSDQPLPKGVLGFADKTPRIVYPYNPKEAKRLLADAGLRDGFEFTAMVVNPPFFVQLAEAVQAQLAAVGIKMKIQPAPIPQVNTTYFQKGAADAYVGLNLAPADPSATMANLYLKDGFFNPSHATTSAIQNAYKDTIVRTDSDDRDVAFERLVASATAQAYQVGLCNVLTPVAYSDIVKQVTADVPTWTWDFYGLRVQRH